MSALLNISQLIAAPIFQELHSLGLVNTVALRNLAIKHKYKILRRSFSVLESISMLADLFHLSDSAINSILFKTQNIKSFSIDSYIAILSED
jgi:hypothetical protein